jgi:adenosine deaminase
LAHTRKALYTLELHLIGDPFAHRRCSRDTYNGQMEAFIRGLPKAELHLHLEGTLEPELAVRLARKHGIKLPHSSVEELRRSYQFTDLQSFLDIYLAASGVLRDEDDFHALTAAYLRRAQQQGITHVEVFFDPQSHTERGIALVTVLSGIHRALLQGERERGITYRLILCFLRHLSVDDAMRTLEQALPHKAALAAVGLDSSEKGHPPAKFAPVFERARQEGLLAVAHAGEEGPADYVRDALDILKVQRIDHGVRCEEDPQLVERLARERIPLTMCPLSNLKLKVFERMEDHNLRRLLQRGLCVTVNSDDPAYFGGYLNDNYLALHRGLGVTADELVQLARNSFEASFLSTADKARWQSVIDEYVRRTPAP